MFTRLIRLCGPTKKILTVIRFYPFGWSSFLQRPKMLYLKFSRGKNSDSETYSEKPVGSGIKKRSIQLIDSDDDSLVDNKKKKR